jgi:hypothetical protein
MPVGVNRILLSLLAFTSGIMSVGCASTRSSFTVNSRRSEQSIREQLLVLTPIGANVREVVATINTRLRHEGGWFPSSDQINQRVVASSETPTSEFERFLIPDLSPRFAEKWNGETLNVEIVVAVHQGIPFRVWTIATWQFGRDGTLRDIAVKKLIDGL